MDYQRYNVEDFVLDAAFRKWVLDPDHDSRIFWTQWLDDHPHKAATVTQAIELLRQIPVQQDRLSEQQIASMTKAIESGIDQLEKTAQKPAKIDKTIPISAYAVAQQKTQTPLPIPKKISLLSLFMKVAAGIAFILSMVYVAQQVPEVQEAPEPEIVYEQIVKETLNGQKLTVYLTDGSQVMLNAGSRMSFTKPFHPEHRTVNLEGEAFFEVATDSLRPFQVISGELATTALGTSFNIEAYPRDKNIQVSLVDGKVKVDYQQSDIKQSSKVYFLESGEQLGYNRLRQILSKQPFDTKKILAWKQGIIYFENANQETVVKILERWYGIHIHIKGKSITAWNITAEFNNQSLKSVLTSLSYTMNFVFEIEEDQVFIKYL